MNAKLFVGGASVLAASFLSGQAGAWVHACNNTSHTIWVAYADHGLCDVFGAFDCGVNNCGDNNNFYTPSHMTGWYQVASGACTTPNGGDAGDFYHWMYAEDAYGHYWSGNSYGFEFCTPWSAFDRCTNLSHEAADDGHCSTDWPYYTSGSFRVLEYLYFGQSSTDNWTVNFNP